MNGDLPSRTHCHRRNQFGSATLAALAGVAVGAILVLLAVLLVLVTRDDPAENAVSTAPSASPAPVSVTRVAPPTVKGTTTSAPAPPIAIGDVRSLPSGLFCRDLKAKGYSYVAAIDYWRFHGQPNQMDADRNGIPCETVYSRSDVASYWNGRVVSGSVSFGAGLFCRDLVARGATYAQAVFYWYNNGMPDRMDADKNGVPCETVYAPAIVESFWAP